MRHSLPLATQFYVTASQPCPYLEGKLERKLFAGLQGDHANTLNDALSKQGFRRSQNVLYRPSCTDCNACMSARIRVADFSPTKSQKRILRKNSNLMRNASTPWATEHQYELFKRYLETRHADGGMADMDMFEFSAMVEETPVRSRIVEYITHNPIYERGELKAVCLTDLLDDGLSLVYSFFDPDMHKNSLGTYMILDHIQIAKEAGIPYVYLGYWVPGSPKMGYKSGFNALEIFTNGDWMALENPEDFKLPVNTDGADPISEQIAAISLPDVLRTGDL
jgi:arginyl-tRNA--protein-N-Asp/Glu arginylyltransferase